MQKLFNMAEKNYLCIYLCRNELGLENVVKPYKFDTADCPIDGMIIKKIPSAEKSASVTWRAPLPFRATSAHNSDQPT